MMVWKKGYEPRKASAGDKFVSGERVDLLDSNFLVFSQEARI